MFTTNRELKEILLRIEAKLDAKPAHKSVARKVSRKRLGNSIESYVDVIMADKQVRTIARVHKEVQGMGKQAKRHSVASALSKRYLDGKLKRVGNGVYQAA